jgi:hypothetical protein
VGHNWVISGVIPSLLGCYSTSFAWLRINIGAAIVQQLSILGCVMGLYWGIKETSSRIVSSLWVLVKKNCCTILVNRVHLHTI